MQGGRGGRDPFFGFGDPFAGFGGFGGFGGQRSLMSSFFGGRDPFDDPFFTRPFGGMFESNFFGPSGNPFTNMQPSAFIEHEAPQPKRSRGPIIEELNSDDEEGVKENKPRKHGRSSNGPFVEDPDDEVEGRSNKHLQYSNDYGQYSGAQQQPQTRSFSFLSSSVTYGGPNGAYYTSSTSRRTGSDGLTIEESKEADTASRQATHRISRGLHNKGHSLTRKLNSDGQVNAVQTLHNLNEDELAGFEDSWNVKARKHLPGWTGSLGGHIDMGGSISGQNKEQVSRGGWALPSTEGSQNSERLIVDRSGSSRTQHRGRMKNTSDVGEMMGNPRGGRSRD